MSYKNFALQIIIRLILVTAGLFGILYFTLTFTNYIRLFFTVLFTLIAIIELFYYLLKTNRDTTQFLEAIIHNDFTQKYSAANKGKSFGKLYETFNRVNEKFHEVSQREASEYHYIITLIQQLKIGVLSYDEKGRIHLANEALKNMLGKDELINLDSIQKVSSNLVQTFSGLKVNESRVEKIQINGKEYQLSISVSEFKLRMKHYRLVSIQDIRGALDKNEMMAWQKLIRVLTHEIMNSVAPITSLSSTLNMMIANAQKNQEALTEQQLQSIHDGLDAIENRSGGLMNFTQAYRSLTRIPLPNIKPVNGQIYFQRIVSLFQPTLASTGIDFQISIPKGDFTLNFDPDLMEQVIINLLKNAKEALEGKEKAFIRLTAAPLNQPSNWEIRVEDNAGGMTKEVEENLFIPFYTTKQNGSGVGLSLVKQIVHAHHGEIELNIDEKQGITSFTIIL